MFASQESSKFAASKMLQVRIDTLQGFNPLWKSTKISIIQCFRPKLLTTELIRPINNDLKTLYLGIKQKAKCHNYSIMVISPNWFLGVLIKTRPTATNWKLPAAKTLFWFQGFFRFSKIHSQLKHDNRVLLLLIKCK